MGCCVSGVLPQVDLPPLPDGIFHLTTATPKETLDEVVQMMARAFAGTTTSPPEVKQNRVFL
jgi:hypothetical protein